MPPVVSVILPTYNRGKTLKRAIESVLNQTFDDLELIVIDDCSSDQSAAILASYAGHDKVRLISQIRNGCAVARNIGVEAAQGRYVAFQDSDDEWRSDKLEKAVASLEKSGPTVGVFYSDMLRVSSNGDSYYFKAPEVKRGILINEKTLDYQVCNIGIQSALIRRECFETTGLFDEALPRFIDLELFIRLSDHFDFIYCREPLVNYCVGEGISTNEQARASARQYLLRKYRNRLKIYSEHFARQLLHIAFSLNLTGQKLKTCEYVLRALIAGGQHRLIRNEAVEIVRSLVRTLRSELAGESNKLMRVDPRMAGSVEL